MEPTAHISVVVDETAPDAGALAATLLQSCSGNGSRGVGAVVTFSGNCRDEDGKLEALVLEHYPGMAETELKRIASYALDKHPCLGLAVHHRHGKVVPGDVIVAVAAVSAHREAAFKAANLMMDFLKTDAPFWKREIWKDGSESWVDAKSTDADARESWSEGR